MLETGVVDMEEKLREAACFGDLEGMLALLNQGAEVNSQHKVNGWTALHWAAKRNNLQCVEALLSRGADKMLFTSKGELAAHLTTNRNVLQVLGYSGHHTRERQRKRSQQQATETGATAEEDRNIVPNYIRHPPLNYKVDLSQITMAKQQQQQAERSSSSMANNEANTLPRLPSSKSGGGGGAERLHVATSTPTHPQVSKARSAHGFDDGPAPVRILKMRLVGREEYDRDFIEVDVPPHCLTFRRLIEVICEEFSVDPKIIVKIRKLPNTKLRRDVEIQRLLDYQELEVETTAAAAAAPAEEDEAKD